jgi:hypothetical protein
MRTTSTTFVLTLIRPPRRECRSPCSLDAAPGTLGSARSSLCSSRGACRPSRARGLAAAAALDVSDKECSIGLLFVAVSRCRNSDNLAFHPGPSWERINSIQTSEALEEHIHQLNWALRH